MRSWKVAAAVVTVCLAISASVVRAEEEQSTGYHNNRDQDEESQELRPNPMARIGLILDDSGPINPAATLGVLPVGTVGRLTRGVTFAGVVSRPSVLNAANPKAGFGRLDRVRVSYLGGGRFSVTGLDARQPKAAVLRVGGARTAVGR